ncbi:hypothetical protein CkaCkLH20_02211 [Colletotrichum karsti]|uniref:Major facilitator superfamily (MFS) profile domain-containing protein n=1 Tax=Colletotrichum karsti TaxID=1095194 RepID=A0A9P6IBB3_9PEZI|nr:uncharacterized protein CkaCkLH20_02211 [Colletotrichum karsti]KAF9880257.1 hypothetical protein CkaCkLH20_02211 [Colletotrichum karsti]
MDTHDTAETDFGDSAEPQRIQINKPQGANHPDRHVDDTAYVRVAHDEDVGTPSEYPKQKATIFTILTDFASILLPLGFLGVVIVLWRLDGTPATVGSEEMWRNAINILATVFPILFAAIVGRLLSEASRWKLERGSSTGVLEQLMGSRTVGATVSTMIGFRSLNALTLLLLLIWTFSPLGTQAILRMESTNFEPDLTDTSVTYFDTDAISDLVERTGRFSVMSYSFSSFTKTLASLYMSLLTTPVAIKEDTVDLWGNVKIPFLSHPDSSWENISGSNVVYSSLAGIPVDNFHDGNTTFNLESSYLRLQCSNVSVGPAVGKNPAGYEESVDPSMMQQAATINIGGDDPKRVVFQMPNGTWHGYNTSSKDDGETTWVLAINRFVDARWLLMNNTALVNLTDNHAGYRERPCLFTNETGIEAGRTTLLFQAEPRSGYSKASVTYTPIQSYCDVTQREDQFLNNLTAQDLEVRLAQLLNTYLTLRFMQTTGSIQAFLLENQLRGYSARDVGWITGVYSFLTFMLGIQTGPLVDVFGPAPLGPIAAFMLCLGVLGGIGNAISTTVGIAVVGKLFHRHRGLALGIALAGSSTGGIVFPLALRQLFPAYGWIWSLRIIGFITLGIMVIGLACLSPFPRLMAKMHGNGHESIQSKSAAMDFSAFRSTAFSLVTFAQGSLEFVIFGATAILPTLVTWAGFPPEAGYNMLAILNGLSSLGRVLPGIIGDHLGHFNVLLAMIILTVICTAATITAFGSTRLEALYAFAALGGFGTGSFLSLAPGEVTPQLRRL